MADSRPTAPPQARPAAGPVERSPSPSENERHPIASRARLPGRLALHRWTVGLFVTYLVALALIAFWPTPVDRDAHDSVVWFIDLLQRLGAPGWVRYNAIEFAANIVLFVPVGLFVVILAGGRRWWLGPLAGFGASCAIELGQLVFLPARFATVSDVVANSSGAIIGTALALFVLLLHNRASRIRDSVRR